MSTKYLSYLVAAAFALVAVVTGSTAHAQSALPAVYVENVKIETTDVSVGQTIKGSFLLSNNSSVAAGDVYYTVTVLGDYVGDEANAVYDVKTMGPVFLEANQKRTTQFTYTLPKTAAGKVGIEIRAKLKSGMTMGWETATLDVKGQAVPETVSYTDVALLVGEQSFEPQLGPTVRAGQTAKLQVSLNNSDTKSVVLTPTITINDFNAGGKQLRKYTEKAITVGAGAAADAAFDLPLFENKAGVYEGTLTFSDASNAERSRVISFRYIVGGTIATIQAVSANATTAVAGQPIAVSVAFVGTPEDITELPDETTAKSATLRVELMNAQGEVLGSADSQVSLTSQNQTQQVSISPTKDSSALTARVTITADGKVVASYDSVLSKAKPGVILPKAGPSALYIALIILVALLTLAILIKRGRARQIALSLAIVLAGVAASSGIVIHAGSTAQTINFTTGGKITIPPGIDSATSQSTWCQYCNGITIFLNSLKTPSGGSYTLSPNSTIYRGEPFKLSGNVQYSACGNFPLNPSVKYKVTDVTTGAEQTATVSTACSAKTGTQGCTDARTSDFTTGSISFSSTGQKKIHIKFTATRDVNSATKLNSSCKTQPGDKPWLCPVTILLESDMNVTVVDKPLNAACSATPTSVETGDTVTWKANNVSGGTGSYTYAWESTAGGESLPTTNSATITKQYQNAGQKSAKLTVTSGSQTKTVNCSNSVNVVNQPPITGQCQVSYPANPKVGDEVGWSITNISGGGGNTALYTYTWSGDENLSGTGQSVAKTYETAGLKEAEVRVQSDSMENTFQCNVNIGEKEEDKEIKCQPEDQDNPGIRIIQQQAGKNVKWVITDGPNTGTFTWTGTDIATPVTSQGKSITKQYTIEGSKTMTVTTTAPGWKAGKCNAPAFRISTDPGFREF